MAFTFFLPVTATAGRTSYGTGKEVVMTKSLPPNPNLKHPRNDSVCHPVPVTASVEMANR